MTKLSTVVPAEPTTDLAVVAAMAEELDSYIDGDDVYRTLVLSTSRGEERVLSSGGDLLARLHKLTAQNDQLSPDQQRKMEELRRRIDEIIHPRRQRFLELLERETKARLNSLKWYIEECSEDRRQCRVNYPYEIRNRQRVAEIWKMLCEKPPEGLSEQIDAIDGRLRTLVSTAEFVWDDKVRDVYPRSEYWYLFALPAG